ncbi:MAG: pyrroline-5-carboxylate reductase [Micavibrio aeruginosavorus]|uniref:Pyrroline-5-carboxylate reductase n=1 Tax=Micavibrio aeruginosavorus TaxID=349221 RepID=A0A2W5HI39_9BACT|nr:MAG: pyrroline-5-carboxylate reductase [Micavibrio aeruginosavorus]
MQQKILLVGCGKMGSALLEQWNKNIGYHIFVLDPSTKRGYESLASLPVKQFNIIVLAVKPQVMDKVLSELTRRVTSSLYVSIAAGKTLKYLEKNLPPNQAIIRTMPNTPAMVGKGMTVACANALVSSAQKTSIKALFENVGQFEWVADETFMDAVTAVSGSGPAYVFLLIEELAKAGAELGLPADLAMKLARQTVIGSAALAEAQKDIPIETLRKNVTSPGGTTEAALEILTDPRGLSLLIQKAISAASTRSRELS